MKKTFLAVTVVTLIFVSTSRAHAYATDAGSWSFAGELSLETGYGEAWDSLRISGSPSVSWFFLDGLSLKASLWFERQEVAADTVERNAAYLGVDWYFRGPASKIFPFVGLAAGGGRFAFGGTSLSYAGIRVDAGMVFLFNETIGIRLLASWFRDQVDTGGNASSGGRIMFGAGVHIFLF